MKLWLMRDLHYGLRCYLVFYCTMLQEYIDKYKIILLMFLTYDIKRDLYYEPRKSFAFEELGIK